MASQAGEGRIYVFMITSSKQGLFLYHWFSFVNSTVATTNYHPPQLFTSIYTPLTKTHTLSKRPSSAVKGRTHDRALPRSASGLSLRFPVISMFFFIKILRSVFFINFRKCFTVG
ncbi:hypothetical protein BKA60DRAFT_552268 [Fusarium oxysporum]|nr:hypothetical protein BKA60DRAFT_552268 [Fusarium oxysporum]